MAVRRALTVVTLVAVVGLMLLPGASFLGSSAASRTATPGSAPTPGLSLPGPAPAAPSPALSGRIASIEATLRQDGVPHQDVHLPNFAAADPGRAGPVTPTYSQAPAPMGVADLGLENESGTIVPTVLSSSRVEGTANFTNADSVYLDGDGPNMFGVQMNAVATGVTLYHRSTYQFWAQDYLSYTPDNGTLSFGDNLWNFSSPVGAFPANTLHTHGPNGTLVAPVYYYAVGPTVTVHYPFSVTFEISTAISGDRPEIFFNYSVNSAPMRSFDYVVFNSVRGIPLQAAPLPEFQANGTGVGPSGLPNDMELVLVGNGDGDTTSFVELNARFSLATWNSTNGTFDPVPTAYDAGSDTGETSDGVGVFFNATATGAAVPVADLELGPSFLYGLWGMSGATGYRTLTSDATPANAFLFVTPGTAFNATVGQWAPTLAYPAGGVPIAFPNGGNYYFEWMLSDYRPVHRSLDPAANATVRVTATLARVNSLGIYTPLFAWGNSELPYISSTGDGLPNDSYVLEANQPHPIDTVFATLNDWLFPVFPGVMVVGTNAWLRATPSSLSIAYPTATAALLSTNGLPTTDHLQIEFWDVSNVTLEGDGAITGWLSANVGFSPLGAVIFWGSTGNLIAANTFYDEGISLAFYGGTNNTVWGNSFLNSTAPATNQSNVENSGNNTTGVWEAESGDLVYNNYFALPAPAYTATIDPVSCEVYCTAATYVDRWNVTLAPAATIVPFLGMNLSGSIIGTTYQGGNYWSNYGTPTDPIGVLPYNDGGRITVGGDYHPLVRTAAYPVAVNELGLAAGTVWGVEVAGIAYRTNATLVTVYEPNGTYNFTVLEPTGYLAPATGNFTINGTGAAVTIVFAPLVAVTFNETGLFAGTLWNVTLNATGAGTNATVNSTARAITLEVVPGMYLFQTNATGYNATPENGTLVVGNASLYGPTIAFVSEVVLNFTAAGLPVGTPFTVEISAGAQDENFTSLTGGLEVTYFEVPTTDYSWTASAAGYTVLPGSGAESPGEISSYLLRFSVVLGTIEGQVSVDSATVYVNATQVTTTAGGFNVQERPGVVSVVVVDPGYVTYYNNVTVTSGGVVHLAISLTPIPPRPARGPYGISETGWAIIAALAVIAVLAIALAVRSSRRRGPPPSPVVPYAGVAPTAPAAVPPPWQEDPSDTAQPPPAVPPPSP